MKVLIIEDEAPAFRRLQKVLEEAMPNVEIVDVIDSVSEAVKWWENHHAPDLVFMDIQLSDGLSFEIFEQANINRPVIFTTAFDEYTLRAFKVNSIDYLLKPIKKDDLAASLAKYQNMKTAMGEGIPGLQALIKGMTINEKKYKNRFLVKTGEKLISIPTQEIEAFFTRGGLVYLSNQEGRKYVLDFTLDELSQQLDPNEFFRANRQYIVNIEAIKSAERYYKGKLTVQLYSSKEERIIISAEKASAFKQWLGEK